MNVTNSKGQTIEIPDENVSLRLMQTIPHEPEASVKLMKMSKGYQWEIKVDVDGADDEGALKRIADIDAALTDQYGDKGA
jgi:phosphotransferase system HPr-like phosphotransfer protein